MLFPVDEAESKSVVHIIQYGQCMQFTRTPACQTGFFERNMERTAKEHDAKFGMGGCKKAGFEKRTMDK